MEKQVIGKQYLMKQAFSQEELHEREAVCTRDDPPGCQAACPLHIDMRAVCDCAAKGNYVKAAAVIRTVTPFLHLLAKNCGGTCVKGCKLAECGDGIALKAMERACALYGGSGKVSRFMLPKKNRKMAVAGDDLFALACLWELGKKGYEVFWYTACGSMEEILVGWGLTEEEIRGELTAFQGLRIEKERREVLLRDDLPGFLDGKDGGCISPAAGWTALPDGFYTAEIRESAEWILADAKHAALLAERYVQGVHGEPEKGPVESRLFVTMDGVEGSRALAAVDSVTKESATAEAARCIQCQCLECVKGCVYLQHYRRNPRAAIREIYNNMSIVMGNHMANGMINACDECGQCQTACPNGFDYPDVCRIAKHTMVETKKMPPSAHEFALLDQEFSNGEAFFAKAAPGYDQCRYLFFPGCQAGAVSPDTVEAAYADLRARLTGGVGLVLGCCGAISKWAAREDLSAKAMEQFVSAWERMGRPAVICACPTCKQVFSEHTDMEVVGIWDILLSLGWERRGSGTVAVHDACSARGDARTQEGIRAFAEALGYRVEEASLSGDLSPCCGYGGLVKYANPEVSRKKAEFAAGRTKQKLLTYCMACRDQFSRAGKDTCHILELAYGVEPGPVPGLSERRANRLKLKQKLLRDVWKESFEVDTMAAIDYAKGVEAQMETRMILKSDVAGVLKAYEASGEAVYDEETGWLSAGARFGNVTFWVKFTEDGGVYTVRGAYSHRMTVE
ncbi:MAG TPA: aldehyde dehydrogenase [Lachnospiraceae bacterium]|nr:aldehyde dehydrogenase [Lachnospiraceae bacterium]